MAETKNFRYDPADAPRNRSLRVGDRERDAVAAILRERHVEGRIDTDELQARLERCIAAKTYAELDTLIADFPRDEPVRRRVARGRRYHRPWPIPFPLVPIALVAVIVVGVHLAWLVVPLFCFFVARPLIFGAWGRRV